MLECPHQKEVARLKDLVVNQAEEMHRIVKLLRAAREEIRKLRSLVPEEVANNLDDLEAVLRAKLKAAGAPDGIVDKIIEQAKELGLSVDQVHVESIKEPLEKLFDHVKDSDKVC